MRVGLQRILTRRLVAVARRVGGRVRGHVHGHGVMGRRRRDGGRVAASRTGEGRHRPVADGHVPLLEPGHVLREGDRRVEGAVVPIRRARDVDCWSIEVRLHREHLGCLVVPTSTILERRRTDAHAHGSARGGCDLYRVVPPVVGVGLEGRDRAVHDGEIFFREADEIALGHLKPDVEGSALRLRRSGDPQPLPETGRIRVHIHLVGCHQGRMTLPGVAPLHLNLDSVRPRPASRFRVTRRQCVVGGGPAA